MEVGINRFAADFAPLRCAPPACAFGRNRLVKELEWNVVAHVIQNHPHAFTPGETERRHEVAVTRHHPDDVHHQEMALITRDALRHALIKDE